MVSGGFCPQEMKIRAGNARDKRFFMV